MPVKTVEVLGYIPPGLYASNGKRSGFAQQWSSLDAMRANQRLVLNWLGVTRGRLMLLLGSDSMANCDRSKKQRLAPYLRDRVEYLLYLKEKMGINVAGIRSIDWERGRIFFYDGAQPSGEGDKYPNNTVGGDTIPQVVSR